MGSQEKVNQESWTERTGDHNVVPRISNCMQGVDEVCSRHKADRIRRNQGPKNLQKL